MNQNKCYIIFWEMVLILGSIPVFRSVWMLCDGVEFMNRRAGILLSFVVGIVLCVMSLIGLNGSDKEMNSDARDDSLRQKTKRQ
jgi:hypothetical protein